MKRNRNNGEFRDDVCGKFVFINPVSGKDNTADADGTMETKQPLTGLTEAPEVPMAPAGPQTSSVNADKVVATLKKYWWVWMLLAIYLLIERK